MQTKDRFNNENWEVTALDKESSHVECLELNGQ